MVSEFDRVLCVRECAWMLAADVCYRLGGKAEAVARNGADPEAVRFYKVASSMVPFNLRYAKRAVGVIGIKAVANGPDAWPLTVEALDIAGRLRSWRPLDPEAYLLEFRVLALAAGVSMRPEFVDASLAALESAQKLAPNFLLAALSAGRIAGINSDAEAKGLADLEFKRIAGLEGKR